MTLFTGTLGFILVEHFPGVMQDFAHQQHRLILGHWDVTLIMENNMTKNMRCEMDTD